MSTMRDCLCLHLGMMQLIYLNIMQDNYVDMLTYYLYFRLFFSQYKAELEAIHGL